MNITMDVSDILLYLKLKRQAKKPFNLSELNMMLYFLENYEQVKEFLNAIKELDINMQYRFRAYSLIHFIEDYDDCIDLRESIFQNTKRRYSRLFMQQILLSKSKEQALDIIKIAKSYDCNLDEEVWSNRFNSLDSIKSNQKQWKESQLSQYKDTEFPSMFEEFNKLKTEYFNDLSLTQIKRNILNQKSTDNSNRKDVHTSAFIRSVYIKEFAKRVAEGICQLCESPAPFSNKFGEPFLEVHHVHYLSKGGSDTIDNVIALCPNCHRKIHSLELEEDINKILEKALSHMKM